MKRFRTFVVAAACLAAAGGAQADVWDLTNDNDNDSGSNNTLLHGTEQVHDLADLATGDGDRDWYYLPAEPYSSYEVLVEGQTGDLDFDLESLRRFAFPATFQQNSIPVGPYAFALRWANTAPLPFPTTIQVRALACDVTPCVTTDQYRIRSYDTTYAIPRFNNTGTQTTVFLIQNRTSLACAVQVHFFTGTGTFVATSAAAVPARGLLTLPTVGPAANQSGSARVTHDCGWGGLSGKAVSLEPSTGFTFDTAMESRPN